MHRFPCFSKLRTIAVGLLITAAPAIFASGHEKIFALSGGFNTKNTSGVAGVHFTYGLNSFLRISPSASYIFKHDGIDAFTINADCQFAFRTSQSITIYPLAGIGYWSWNVSSASTDILPLDAGPDTDDVNSRSTRYSINMGGGVQWMATETLALTLEGKYALMKHSPTAIFSISIGYRF